MKNIILGRKDKGQAIPKKVPLQGKQDF